jgi:hypothetical protein
MNATTTTAPFAPTSVARGDFPGWLPPMVVKELRQGLRTKGFAGAFIIFQALMAITMLAAVTSAVSTNPNVRAATLATINGFFWTLLSLQMLVFTPGRALGSLQSEAESRTLDLLVLTRLDAWRIVAGKWASLMAQAALLLIAMLPYGIVRYFAGAVDLVGDASMCAVLFGGCGLLTAAGLWGSGMGKVFRLLGVVLLVMGSSIGSSAFGSFFRGVGVSFSPGAAAVALVWLDGALVLLFFLVAAVRNIAPRAENHALLARSLPLLALAAVPFASVFGVGGLALRNQLVFAGAFLMIVCAVEFASMQWPMMVHCRPWRARAPLARVVFRMALPGWPSALLYATVGAVLWVFCALALDATHTGVALLAWPALLGLGALALPAVGLSMATRLPRSPGGVYTVFLAFGVVVAVLGLSLPQAFPRFVILRDMASMLPVSSFVITVFGGPPSSALLIVQGVLAALTLAVAWWQARVYWQHLALLEAPERVAKS